MRKLMLLAAMLAMVMAAAAPALGQGDIGDVNEGDDQFNVGDETVYSAVCQNLLGAFDAAAGQYATALASASAGDNAAAVAEIAQEQGVSVEQVNECLNNFASVTPTAPVDHADGGGGGGGGGGGSASATALPATGGLVPSSALALGAGALLVGGGLLARRMVR